MGKTKRLNNLQAISSETSCYFVTILTIIKARFKNNTTLRNNPSRIITINVVNQSTVSLPKRTKTVIKANDTIRYSQFGGNSIFLVPSLFPDLLTWDLYQNSTRNKSQ